MAASCGKGNGPPCAMNMFSGLTSRCTSWCLCMCANASEIYQTQFNIIRERYRTENMSNNRPVETKYTIVVRKIWRLPQLSTPHYRRDNTHTANTSVRLLSKRCNIEWHEGGWRVRPGQTFLSMTTVARDAARLLWFSRRRASRRRCCGICTPLSSRRCPTHRFLWIHLWFFVASW